MKKIIAIAFAAALALIAISCQKEEAVSDKTDAVQYTFNITVNDQAGFDSDAATKGNAPYYKTSWESGDRIFLFFKPTGESLLEDRYATLTYNGSSWDGAVADGQSSLGEGGTLSAVYVYNLNSSVSPEFSDSKWTIATGNVFYNCETEVDYTVFGSEISASLELVAPGDFVQFYVGGAEGDLTCDKVKGWKDIAIGGDMAVSNVTCTGYMDGFANSGDNTVNEYYGRIVNGTSLYDVTCNFNMEVNGTMKVYTAKPVTDGARSFYMDASKWTASTGKAKASIGGSDVYVKWIQLWKDGPKFAEYNVGVTDGKKESCGGYYTWGGNTDNGSGDFYKGSGSLSGEYDTATKLWGSNWRMPTNEELGKYGGDFNDGPLCGGLLYECSCSWVTNYNSTGVNGLLCTGKGSYSSNSIFLPAAGYKGGYGGDYKNSLGQYWSSSTTPFGSSYYLNFDSSTKETGVYMTGYNFSVRAVLNENNN